VKLLVLAIDGRGMGHLSRTILLAQALRVARPEARVRFLVESPAFGLVENAGFPVLKLPDPMHPLGRHVLVGRRAQLEADLMAPVVDDWRPDAVLIDFVIDKDLFRSLRRNGCRVLLVLRRLQRRAMRELISDPAASLVDAFVIPHEPNEFEHGEIPASWRARCHFTGPLVRRFCLELVPELRKRYAVGADELVIVSIGGGGSGEAVDQAGCARQALLDLRRERPGLRGVIVYGPLYKKEIPTDEPGVCGIRFEAQLPELMAAADAVVCTAGYNSVRELLASGTPGVLVPLSSPGRDDQIGRAESVRREGRALVARMDAGDIAQKLMTALAGEGPRRFPAESGGDYRRAGEVRAGRLRS